LIHLGSGRLGSDQILLERAHESLLLGMGLEATMSKLGGGVDQLQVDLLQGNTLGVDEQRLAESKHPLFVSDDTSLDHQEVVLHFTIVREASHGVDALVGDVLDGASVVLDQLASVHVVSLAHAVHLLVDLGTVVVTLLTGTGDSIANTGQMPGSDTGNLAQTLVGLTGQLLGSPTGGHTLESVSLGDTDDVDQLVLSEDLRDGHGLLQALPGPLDLISDAATIELDLHNMSLLLALVHQFHLGVSNDADDGAILLHDVQVLLDLLLAHLIGPLLGGLGESLLLGTVPAQRHPQTHAHRREEKKRRGG